MLDILGGFVLKKSYLNTLAIAAAVAVLAVLPGCGNGGLYKDTRTVMGTYVTVTAERDGLPEVLVRAAVRDAFAEIERVDSLMSTYRDDSELSEVNRMAGVSPVKVSEDTADTVRLALRIAGMTDGAFDPTVGPLVKLWKVTSKDADVPHQADIDAARRLVDYRSVEVTDGPDGPEVFVKKKGMSLDLGGVAKGYAADLAAEKMMERGVKAGIVAVAGDLRLFGRRPDGSAWRIGIQHPRDESALLTKLDITDAATSTSGDYERYFVKDGVRYNHIINPRTGYPARGLISVSVEAKTSSMADPLATALFVMGPEGAKRFAESHPEISVLTVSETGRTFATGDFEGLDTAPVSP